MYLKSIELLGFKSFARKSELKFTSPITGIVGPNGSGKSNTAEAFRFVLGEQSMKAMRGKRGPDMIWTGNDRLACANRARISVVFDNKQQLFDIDFDEVVIERAVHRDGANEYFINGSKVRLKDITELLSSANIGSSGHHIISQGEADRILGASEKERREMIEDALGLKVYQYKKLESEKKLEKTINNMKEVKTLRREIAPHLKFLERQMKKLERIRELKAQIKQAYSIYIAHERAYILNTDRELQSSKVEPSVRLEKILNELNKFNNSHTKTNDNSELKKLDEYIRNVATEKGRLERSRGRIEGQIALVMKEKNESKGQSYKRTEIDIPFRKVASILEDIRSALSEKDISVFGDLIKRIDSFLNQPKITEEIGRASCRERV